MPGAVPHGLRRQSSRLSIHSGLRGFAGRFADDLDLELPLGTAEELGKSVFEGGPPAALDPLASELVRDAETERSRTGPFDQNRRLQVVVDLGWTGRSLLGDQIDHGGPELGAPDAGLRDPEWPHLAWIGLVPVDCLNRCGALDRGGSTLIGSRQLCR